MPLKPLALANTAAISIGVFYVICTLTSALAPEFVVAVAQSWVHSLNIGQAAYRVTTESFILGLLTSSGLAWVFGYGIAWLYRKLS